MLKAAIFDLDGVVVETVHLHFAAWKRMFSEYNVDFTMSMYKEKSRWNSKSSRSTQHSYKSSSR